MDLQVENPPHKIEIGTVNARGYIIRKAKVFLNSIGKDIEDPKSSISVEVIADLVWANRNYDSWNHSTNTQLKVDIDKEQFLMDNKVIDVINGKEIFMEIMRTLVGSLRQCSK